MSMILSAVLGIAAQTAEPARSLASYFSSDDYPDAAVLLGQEGDVQVELSVAANGTPTGCTVLHSSGYPALDNTTCAKFKARARFSPARDSSGRPTVSTYTQTVRWRLEGNELPVAPWTIRLLAALDKHGSLTNCAIQAGGALKRDEILVDCAELSGAFTVPPELAARYAGHQAVLIFDQQFVPERVNSIDTPPDLTRFPLISREVLRFGIDPQGQVGGCNQAKPEGDYESPVGGCAAMQARRFKPAAGAKTVTATATTAIYAYVK